MPKIPYGWKQALIVFGLMVGVFTAAHGADQTVYAWIETPNQKTRQFVLEVAGTPQEKQRGLQHRRYLSETGGMLFPFERPERMAFWMKDCDMALDILFFHNNLLVDAVDSAPPCRPADEPCPLYRPKQPADKVVELRAGSRQKYGFTVNQSRLNVSPTPAM